MNIDSAINPNCDNYKKIKEFYNSILSCNLHYAMVIINLKHFRYFNTTYGNDQGDELLTLIKQRIGSYLHNDEICSHLYADNFVVLLQYADIDALIERLVESVDYLYRIEDPRIYRELFFSYGVYEIENNCISFENAYNYANLARKSSKTLNERSTSIELYSAEIHETYMEHHALEIKTANAYKNYEFTTFLQPKVDTRTKKIIGAEALLRWYGEDGKLIPLYKFLPILNENGYIQLIDLDCLEVMCKLMKERILKGLPIVPISFNISKTYFYEPSLIKDYITMVEKYGIPKKYIEIELMESISLDDTERLKEVIDGFHEAGFQCTLDDFGNGYSSFNVLLNAKLDNVKMDRQFFLNNLNGDSRLVIRTVIELLKSLQMHIVAEGVETKEHVDFLEECNCDFIQGYYFYKPMPVDEFYKELEKQEQIM